MKRPSSEPLPFVLAVATALSFLMIPQTKSFVIKKGNYLIQSSSCEHCKKVKKYLTINRIAFSKIDIEEIEAKNFATFLNFRQIPILIIKKRKKIEIIKGDKNIINFFETQKENSHKEIEQ